MSELTIISNDNKGIDCAHIVKMTEDDKLWWTVHFKMSRVTWAIFTNNYYDEDIKKFGTDESKYKSITSIPKYSVWKNGNKIGPGLIRQTEEGKPFIFIPKTYKKGGSLAISRDYYIYEIDDDYNIDNKARMLFYQ